MFSILISALISLDENTVTSLPLSSDTKIATEEHSTYSERRSTVLVITSLVLGIINIYYFNLIVFACLCVVNILFLVEIVQRNLLESENNIYLFLFLLLPIMFSYNVLNTKPNANIRMQLIMASIVFSSVFGF